MRKFVFYLFLCIGTVQAAPQKNTPIKPLTVLERKNKLNELKNFLEVPNYNLQTINLFIYKEKTEEEEEVIEEVIEQPPEPTPVVTQTVDYSLLVLRSVGKSIKPEGSLESKGQFVLCIQEGRILKVGDVLDAKYKGKVYHIVLKSITRNRFTLRTNGKELTFQY